MKIDIAIDKLVRFKKIAAKIGDCEIIGLDNDSFVAKVNFRKEEPVERMPILGFAAYETKRKPKKKTV